MQAYIAVRQGRLMERWLSASPHPGLRLERRPGRVPGGLHPRVPSSCSRRRARPTLRQVVQFNNKIDVCGGLYPVDLEEIVNNHFTWIFEPYHQQRTLGKTHGDGALVMQTIRGVCDRLLDLLGTANGGHRPHHRASPKCSTIRRITTSIADEKGDPNSRLVLAARGYRNFISLVATRPNGRYTYSVIRGSPYDDDVFDVPTLLEAFQAAEDLPNVKLWGGSNMAAGSDSELGSSLHWTSLGTSPSRLSGRPTSRTSAPSETRRGLVERTGLRPPDALG